MSRCAVRVAESRDRPFLLDLWVAAWRLTMPQIDFEARRGWLDRHLDDSIASGNITLVAAFGDSAPAGFLMVDPGRGYVDQLAVDPAHRGSGVADVLIAAAKDLCPAMLELDVNRDNVRALRFYARHGFSTIATGSNPHSGLPTLLLQWHAAGQD